MQVPFSIDKYLFEENVWSHTVTSGHIAEACSPLKYIFMLHAFPAKFSERNTLYLINMVFQGSN